MDKVESNDECIPGSVDNEFKLEDLEEFVWRWKKS
jgi:hypothetical protein